MKNILEKAKFPKNDFLWSEFGAFVIAYFKNLGPDASKSYYFIRYIYKTCIYIIYIIYGGKK